LSDEVEARIEARIEAVMDSDVTLMLARSPNLCRAKRIEDAQARYIEYAKRTLSREVSLAGLRVVIDCANRAAYEVAPQALWELGAEGDQGRRRAERPQHQSQCWLNRARVAVAQGA
jgi:phosphoglucosamine mutase